MLKVTEKELDIAESPHRSLSTVHNLGTYPNEGGNPQTSPATVENKSAAEAFAQMREYGHDPTANPHLLEYLNRHMAELAQKLVDRHIIDRVPTPLPVLSAE